MVAIGALIVGCSSGTATPSPTATAAPSPSAGQPSANPTVAPTKANVTIEVMASQNWIKPAEQDLAKTFEAKTGIHVDYQIIPADQYFSVLNTKLNSGQGVDIFLGQAGKSDLKLSLNVEQNAVDLSGEPWVKLLDPTVADQSSLNGKLYGLEIWDVVASNYWVMTYNMDIFAKYGLSVPKTFADFEAVSATLLKNGVTPVYEPISDGWHHVLWFPEVGPQFEDLEPGLGAKLNANQTTFAANQNMTTAAAQLNELYQKGYFGKNALSAKEADTSKAMASGKYAMTLSELSRGAQIATAYPDLKASSFGYFPIPILDNQLQPVHPAGPTKFIYTKSQHIDESKQFLDFLMQPANLQTMIDNTPDFETLPFTGVKAKWDANQQAYLSAYAAKTIVYQDAVNYVNPQWMDIGKDLVAMFTGKQTPADVMKAIDTRRAQQAATAKDPAWAK